MPDFIGDTNHPYYPGQQSGPTMMSIINAARNPAPATTTPTGVASGNVPGLPTGFPGDVTQATATTNLNAMPTLEQISQMVNSINQAAWDKAKADRLGPQGQAIQNQLLQNTASNAAGLVPQDVMNQIMQGQAESYGGSGFGVDSPAMNSAVRRALGLTSIGLQEQAGKDYTQLLAENPSAPIYSPSQGFTTPGQFSQNQLGMAQLMAEYQRLQNEANRTALGAFNSLPTPTPSTTTPANLATMMANRYLANQGNQGVQQPTQTFTPPTGGSYTSTPDTWSQWESEFWNGNPVSSSPDVSTWADQFWNPEG